MIRAFWVCLSQYFGHAPQTSAHLLDQALPVYGPMAHLGSLAEG
jgi:hypothetical protein